MKSVILAVLVAGLIQLSSMTPEEENEDAETGFLKQFLSHNGS